MTALYLDVHVPIAIRGEQFQADGRPFAGLLFGHQLRGSISQYVRDLELIAAATESSEWVGRVEVLPLR